MKKYILPILFLANMIFGEYYSDRLLVYINNSESDFILVNTQRTSNKQLNQKLDQHGALNIHQWLFNARPTDRDGDTYLNRYFVVQFPSSRNDLEFLVKSFSELDCITSAETMTINRPTFIPNDSRWNSQYGLHLIEADLAYDLWDIEGGELPGSMEDG